MKSNYYLRRVAITNMVGGIKFNIAAKKVELVYYNPSKQRFWLIVILHMGKINIHFSPLLDLYV